MCAQWGAAGCRPSSAVFTVPSHSALPCSRSPATSPSRYVRSVGPSWRTLARLLACLLADLASSTARKLGCLAGVQLKEILHGGVGVKVFECGGGGGRKLGVLGAVGRGESNAGRRAMPEIRHGVGIEHLA